MKKITFFITILFLGIAVLLTVFARSVQAQQYNGYGYGWGSGIYRTYPPYRPYVPHPMPPAPWYYQNQYRYPTLNVTCYPSNSWGYTGNPISWTAYASGGSGYYGYSWNGTDYPQNINTRTLNVYYHNPGTKSMNVRVTSGDGQTAYVYCGNVYINPQVYYQQPYPYYY
jgi:hypothetical protein